MSVSDSKIARIAGNPKSIWNSLARSKLLIENDSNDPVIRVVIRKYVIGETEELGLVEWNDFRFWRWKSSDKSRRKEDHFTLFKVASD